VPHVGARVLAPTKLMHEWQPWMANRFRTQVEFGEDRNALFVLSEFASFTDPNSDGCARQIYTADPKPSIRREFTVDCDATGMWACSESMTGFEQAS